MNPFLWHQARLTDREIELLLSGSPEASDEHSDLKWFLTNLADQRPTPPHDVDNMATALASVARASVPDSLRTRPRRAARRLVALAATLALLFAMSGIALAADDAAPGDLLYGVDQAFELIGIGDGGIEERIAEFETLVTRGDDEMAHEFLDEIIESSNEAESAKAQAHLNVVGDARSEVAEDNVAAHQQFIEENKKNGVGADGRDFGQGVADIVRNRDKDLPEQAEANKPDTPANNDETGGPDEAGPPGDAGPPAEPPRQSNSDNNQGSNGNQTLGPPSDTGSNNGSNNGNGSSAQSDDGGNGKSDQTNAGSAAQDIGAPENTGKKDE